MEVDKLKETVADREQKIKELMETLHKSSGSADSLSLELEKKSQELAKEIEESSALQGKVKAAKQEIELLEEQLKEETEKYGGLLEAEKKAAKKAFTKVYHKYKDLMAQNTN